MPPSIPKLPDAELRDRLTACPEIGSLFRHYKGGMYRVVGVAIAEATQEPLVIYMSAASELRFARPLSEWNELVEHDGCLMARFKAVEL
jgi:hypothetical protein